MKKWSCLIPVIVLMLVAACESPMAPSEVSADEVSVEEQVAVSVTPSNAQACNVTLDMDGIYDVWCTSWREREEWILMFDLTSTSHTCVRQTVNNYYYAACTDSVR